VVEEDSRDAYEATLKSFVIFLTRLHSISPPAIPATPATPSPHAMTATTDLVDLGPPATPVSLPEGLRAVMGAFLTEKSTETLHLMLRQLLQPREYGNARLSHPTGWFVQLTAVKVDGSFASLTAINHQLVHLVYAARLVVLWELAKTKPKTLQDREAILAMTKIE